MRNPYDTPLLHSSSRSPGWLLVAAAIGLGLAVDPALAQTPSSPFRVTSTTPARHATAAIPMDPFSLNFSKPVDPATWGGITVFASGKHAINTKGTGATNGRVIVTPAVPLHAGEEVSVTVPASVMSVCNSATDPCTLNLVPYTFSFRAAVAPSPPQGTQLAPERVGVVNPTSGEVCDVDGDGDLDACVASSSGGYVEVLLNTNGHLLPSVARRVTGLPECGGVRCADVDNDGDADLLIWSPRSNIAVWRCINDGTGLFSTPQPIGSGWTAPSACCVADFDADGDLDLAIADRGANEIVVYRNDAGGFTSSSADHTACPGGVVDLQATDVDNDGAPDVVASCKDTGEIAILLWKLGQLGIPSRLSVGGGSNPIRVATGDVNGDGRVDLAVACAGQPAGGGTTAKPSSLVIIHHNPFQLAKFSVKQTIACDRKSGSVIFLDRDGDGDLDIATCDQGGAAVTYCDNGGQGRAIGTYSDGSSSPMRASSRFWTGGFNPSSVCAGDVNGDGILDLLVCCPGSDEVVTLTTYARMDGVGIYPKPWIRFPFPPIELRSTNADDVLDVNALQGIVVRDNHGRSYDHNVGGGTLVVAGASDGSVQVSLSGAAARPNRHLDLTLPDGATGVQFTKLAKSSRCVIRLDAVPSASDGTPVSDGSSLPLNPGDVCTMADWDGDGLNDLIVARRTSGVCCYDVVVIKKALTAAGWAPPITVTSAPIPSTEISRIRCADLDHDGSMEIVLTDLIVSSVGGGGPHVRVFDGATGSLTEEYSYDLPAAATALQLADVNHDGLLDIITADAGGTVVCKWSLGESNPTGPTSGPLSQGRVRLSTSSGIAAVCVDASDPDALYVAASPGGGMPVVKRIPADGTGDFRESEAVTTSLTATGAPADVAVADLDGDGQPEFIVAMPVKSAVAIKTRGTGADKNRIISTGAGSNPKQVCVGDVDGDMDMDLVVVCPGTSSLALLRHASQGFFDIAVNFRLPSPPVEAWLNDCDDDGSSDIVVRCADNIVRVLEVGPLSAQDLVISTPVHLVPGTYRNITVLDGGEAIFDPGVCVTTTGTFLVRTGGAVRGGTCIPNPFGSHFVLEAGGTLEIPQAQGLSGDGSFGPITGPGSVSLSPEASYVYTGTGAQETGPGLPPQVAELMLGNDVMQLSLTNPVTVLPAGKVNFQDLNYTPPIKHRVVSQGKLTLASSAEGTAQFDVRTLQAIGDVTVQQHVPTVPTNIGYHQWSPPLLTIKLEDCLISSATGTPTYTPVVNPAYNTASNPSAVRPFPTVFRFDESRAPTSPDFSQGWYSPTALTDDCPSGRGLSMYLPSGITWDCTGPVAPGDVTVTGLGHTGSFNGADEKSGWHALGNPFPAVLDWDEMTVPAGFSSSVSVFKSTGGSNGYYLTRANGMGSLEGGYLGIGQGFLCRVIDPAPPMGGLSFTLPASATKTHHKTGHVTLMKREAPDPRPRLTLTLAGFAGHDEVVVYCQAGATLGEDAAYDGAKPGRNIGLPTLATLTSTGAELAVNGLPETALASGTTVELLLDLPVAGSYTLAATQLQHVDGQAVQLVDRLTGTSYDLSQHAPVRFTVGRAGEVADRFALVLGAGSTVTGSQLRINNEKLVVWPNPAADVAHLSGVAAGTTVQLLDLTGRVVSTVAAMTSGEALLEVAGLPAGVYTVRAGALTRRLVVE